MQEKKLVCPKCGSEELIDWGTGSRMCRRCHEVFYVDESGQQPQASNPSARAEALLRELHETGVKKEPEEKTQEEQVVNLSMADEAARRLAERQEKMTESALQFEESTSKEFENILQGRTSTRPESRRSYQPSEYDAYRSPQTERKPKSGRAAVVWIIISIVIWIAAMIICQVAKC